MNEEEKVTVLFDRYVGALSVTIGQRQITVDQLPAETEFILSGESDDLRALWLTPSESSYLAKMIRYILEKVKISAEAHAALSAVLPRVEALAQQAEAEGE
ncbi:MAG: hypothetical protein KatS3mg061_1663 [Dehalococcoidia bacterium]|nr:MAG: hypothetical protein KatS3mg061_1663 [Dehalococcoidia bacterium]